MAQPTTEIEAPRCYTSDFQRTQAKTLTKHHRLEHPYYSAQGQAHPLQMNNPQPTKNVGTNESIPDQTLLSWNKLLTFERELKDDGIK